MFGVHLDESGIFEVGKNFKKSTLLDHVFLYEQIRILRVKVGTPGPFYIAIPVFPVNLPGVGNKVHYNDPTVLMRP